MAIIKPFVRTLNVSATVTKNFTLTDTEGTVLPCNHLTIHALEDTGDSYFVEFSALASVQNTDSPTAGNVVQDNQAGLVGKCAPVQRGETGQMIFDFGPQKITEFQLHTTAATETTTFGVWYGLDIPAGSGWKNSLRFNGN